MSFKPQFLKNYLGIDPKSVPEGLTATFTDENHSNLAISNNDTPTIVDTRTRIHGEKTVKKEIVSALTKRGAQPLAAPV